RLPDLLRRQWGRELGDAEFRERVHHTVGDAGRAADRARLAATLGAERIGPARRRAVERHRDRRNIAGARDAIILIARGEQLPFGIIGHALVEGLPDALHDAAMHLPRHQHRIDDAAHVIDRGVPHHTRDAGLRIDLDLADMSAVRPARAIHLTLAVDREPRALILSCDLEQADAAI